MSNGLRLAGSGGSQVLRSSVLDQQLDRKVTRVLEIIAECDLLPPEQSHHKNALKTVKDILTCFSSSRCAKRRGKVLRKRRCAAATMTSSKLRTGTVETVEAMEPVESVEAMEAMETVETTTTRSNPRKDTVGG